MRAIIPCILQGQFGAYYNSVQCARNLLCAHSVQGCMFLRDYISCSPAHSITPCYSCWLHDPGMVLPRILHIFFFCISSKQQWQDWKKWQQQQQLRWCQSESCGWCSLKRHSEQPTKKTKKVSMWCLAHFWVIRIFHACLHTVPHHIVLSGSMTLVRFYIGSYTFFFKHQQQHWKKQDQQEKLRQWRLVSCCWC